ncbi:hypothetical protein Q9R08_05115 [Microbacterium sp. QXD-8]|uniref:Uncharacterized protein n=1 Tax=Microbacterium psychrotolerans TaxID=3068321 RepID=A0ABU0Z009_9MICO|nr:hypothetical protein [Microbacterium sp. QXD-8]MDQ7877353.1 hypothetical protein [Microbacterium sp. QXD-8]
MAEDGTRPADDDPTVQVDHDALLLSAVSREHVWTPTGACYYCGGFRTAVKSKYCADVEGGDG